MSQPLRDLAAKATEPNSGPPFPLDAWAAYYAAHRTLGWYHRDLAVVASDLADTARAYRDVAERVFSAADLLGVEERDRLDAALSEFDDLVAAVASQEGTP